MEDSIEDYIKFSGVGKDPKSRLDKEKLTNVLTTIEFKKKLDEYAQSVVEFLIEGKLRPKIFLKSLNSINESLYEDVVEERSISKLCGYPICGKSLPDMPEKKYIILAKVNKVYDLTDRKKFCSNFCYKASTHIQKQIDNSPLWLRKSDTIYEYNLLPNMSSGLTPGEELVNGVQQPGDESPFTSVNDFTEACLDEAHDNLPDDDLNHCEKKEEVVITGDVHVGKSILKPSTSKTFKIEEEAKTSRKNVQFIDNLIPSVSDEDKLQKEQEELNKSIQNMCKSLNIQLDLNQTSQDIPDTPKIEIQEKQEVYIDDEKMNKAIEKVNECERQRNMEPLLDANTNLEIHAQNEYLRDKIKLLEAPKYSQRIMDISKHKDNSKNTIKKSSKVHDDKMQKILEKLKNKNSQDKKGVIMFNTVENPEVHRAHVEDVVKVTANISNRLESNECAEITKAFHKWLTLETFVYLYGEDTVRKMINTDRLESYFNTLKVSELESSQQRKYMDICKRLQLKELQDAKYDDGCLNSSTQGPSNPVLVLKPVPDYNKLKEEVDDGNLKTQAFYSGQIVAKTKKTEENENQVVLPLVDASNANAMRRNVFNKSILQYIKDHLFELSTPESSLSKVQDLIKTFKFEADNVVFKPPQWNIIAIILINCLRKMDRHLQTDESTEYFDICIKKYPNLRVLLEETDSVVENFDTFIKDHILGNN